MTISDGTDQKYYDTRLGPNTGVSWVGADGMQYSASVDDADVVTWLEAKNKPLPADPPVKPTVISKAAFLERVRPELMAISAAARANDEVNVWMITALAHDFIDLSDQLTKDGIATLVTAGLLTAARAKVVLTP